MNVEKKIIRIFQIYDGSGYRKMKPLIEVYGESDDEKFGTSVVMEDVEVYGDKIGQKPQLNYVDLDNASLLLQLDSCLKKLGNIKVVVLDRKDDIHFGELEKIMYQDTEGYSRDLVIRAFGYKKPDFYIIDSEIKQLYFLGSSLDIRE